MSIDRNELDELLGAYALDAVSDEERQAVEEYLLVDPRARQEVAEHREVATLLAWSGTAAPEGLWDRIAAQLDEPAPAPMGRLAEVMSLEQARADLAAGAAARPSRRRWMRSAAAWAVASAAAAVVAIVVVSSVRTDRNESPLAAAVAEACRASVPLPFFTVFFGPSLHAEASDAKRMASVVTHFMVAPAPVR